MLDTVTPRQVAEALGVSEASLKRWCDKGLLPVVRTPGGHRRLPVAGVLEFIRSCGHELVKPEVLGLPAAAGTSSASLDSACTLFRQALEQGLVERAEQLVMNLYMSNHSIWQICDSIMARAMNDIGDRWAERHVEVYQERRGCEIVQYLLYILRRSLGTPSGEAPLAIGGTLDDDPYQAPTAMVAATLHECGWQTQSLGSGNPVDTLCAAIESERPRLFWLSVSAVDTPQSFLARYGLLYAAAERVSAAVVVGGKALNDTIRRDMSYSAYCDNLGHLANFARTLWHK